MTAADERGFWRTVAASAPRENGAKPEAPAEVTVTGLEPIDWATFWATDHRAEDWLDEPFLPRGRSVAAYGAMKGQKSLWALFRAAKLATVQGVHVVYIDAEMTESDLYERLDDMGYGPESGLSCLHYYLLPSLPPLDTPDGGTTLLNIVRRHGAQLVIIDTTSRVLEGKENDSDTLRNYHTFTGKPLKAAGVTVLRIDHPGKDLTRGMRGTSAKAADVDLVWELTPRDDGLRLKATHRRQGWIPEFVDLTLLEGPLRYERAAESWPAGTATLAGIMDGLSIPLDCSSRNAAAMLKAANRPARRALIIAALRYRTQNATDSGNHHGNHDVMDDGHHDPEPPADQIREPPREPVGTTEIGIGGGVPTLKWEPPPAHAHQPHYSPDGGPCCDAHAAGFEAQP
jgi:hypothetical protein